MKHYLKEVYDGKVDSLDRMLDGDWACFDVTHFPHMIAVEAHPGNGTRYSFALIKTGVCLALQMGLPDDGYLLAMEPGFHWRGTMSVRDPREAHPSYIMEKLGMGLSDAVAMCLILDRVGQSIEEMKGATGVAR